MPNDVVKSLHWQFQEYSDSPLFLSFNDVNQINVKNSESDIISIFESTYEVNDHIQFNKVKYDFQTNEIERIAVEECTKSKDDGINNNTLKDGLKSQLNSLKLFNERIEILVNYTDNILKDNHDTVKDYDLLRSLSSLIASLPAHSNDRDFKQEYENVSISCFLKTRNYV